MHRTLAALVNRLPVARVVRFLSPREPGQEEPRRALAPTSQGAACEETVGDLDGVAPERALALGIEHGHELPGGWIGSESGGEAACLFLLGGLEDLLLARCPARVVMRRVGEPPAD